MTADQRVVAQMLGIIDEAMESNTLHDAVGTWRSLTELKVLTEGMARRIDTDQPSLDDLTHGLEQ